MPANVSNHQRLDDSKFRMSTPQQMLSSCSGALITSFFVTPFDVVKVRLQTQQKTQLSNKCYLYCNGLMDHICPCINGQAGSTSSGFIPKGSARVTSSLTGTVDAFIKISRYEGMASLWSGLSPTLVLAVPATMIYFVSYENLRLAIKDRNNGAQPLWGPLAAGACARMWSVSVVSPLELVRTKMQSKKVSYMEIIQAIKSLLHYHGVRGLWKGLGSTLLRDVPFSALYWMSYESMKKGMCEDRVPTFGQTFVAGALAGTTAALITTPFDVVKTHQQIELGEKTIYSAGNTISARQAFHALIGFGYYFPDPPKPGSSMAHILQKIYQQNGIRGLFTGLTPRLVKVAPACAIMISTFEYGKRFFYRYNSNKKTNNAWS